MDLNPAFSPLGKQKKPQQPAGSVLRRTHRAQRALGMLTAPSPSWCRREERSLRGQLLLQTRETALKDVAVDGKRGGCRTQYLFLLARVMQLNLQRYIFPSALHTLSQQTLLHVAGHLEDSWCAAHLSSVTGRTEILRSQTLLIGLHGYVSDSK